MFETSARYEDRYFQALPRVEPSDLNTPKPRSTSQERSAALPPRECHKICLRLFPPSGLSRISLQLYHHSLPPPGPRSPRPSSSPRCPNANSVHSPALSHNGSGPALNCGTSKKKASRRPGLHSRVSLAGAPKDCREIKLNSVHRVSSLSGSAPIMHLERSTSCPKVN